MEHPPELDLIKLVAGHMPPAQQQASEAHLAQCAACRQRLREVQSLWKHLGSFQRSAPSVDPADAVQAALEPAADPIRASWLSPQRRFVRVAAAMALAAGVGHLAGRAAWNSPGAPPRAAALESLHMNEVFGNGVSRLAEIVAREPRAAGRKETNG